MPGNANEGIMRNYGTWHGDTKMGEEKHKLTVKKWLVIEYVELELAYIMLQKRTNWSCPRTRVISKRNIKILYIWVTKSYGKARRLINKEII